MRADRLLALLMLLQTKGRMSVPRLALELEVCERTVYRDLVALSSAGVPVYGQAGRGGGYQLVESYRTDLTGLTPAEARALFMLNMPGPLARLGLSQDLKTAMLKVSAALPESRRREEERVRQRYFIDTSWGSSPQESQPLLEVVHQAVWEGRRLVITYTPIFDVQIERLVEPYGLAARSGTWYLVYAFGGRVRARRVADLLDARLSGEAFQRPPGFDLGGFWKAWCAAEQQDTLRYPVTVRVTQSVMPAFLRRFGARLNSQAQAGADGSQVISLSFRWIGEARDHLLPFGAGVEVLEPFALRASLADIAGGLAMLYHP